MAVRSEQNNSSRKRSVDLNAWITDKEGPYRVLAMDGGGIYGVFTAIMLRKLCERDAKFLADDRITLFAGTSAGAINALLLARHKNPRDAIETGTLENFFKDERVYSNKLNPVAGALSLVGVTSWCGKADFYSVLDDHFGDMKMKDLKQRVLITAFDLWGVRDESSPNQQRWKPKIFYNFPEGEEDQEWRVKDVAYSAASPPTVRPIVNGITDGGFFANDPSVNAIARIVSEARKRNKQPAQIGELLHAISALSLGVGAMIPHYFLKDFDFGVVPFNLLSTHMGHSFFESPLVTFALNPAKDATMYEAAQLLGDDQYLRLDPLVIGFPVLSVLATCFLSRSYFWRQFFLAQIYRMAESQTVVERIDKAQKWIKDHGWTEQKRERNSR